MTEDSAQLPDNSTDHSIDNSKDDAKQMLARGSVRAPSQVLVLWNRRDDPPEAIGPTELTEGAAPRPLPRSQQVATFVAAVREQGLAVQAIDIEDDLGRLRDALTVMRPQLVVNLIDQFRDDSTRQAAVASLLELLGAPLVGAGATGLMTCQDRVRARISLSYAGLPGPGFVVVRDRNAVPDTDGLRSPLIVTQAFDDVYSEEGRAHPLASREQVLARCASLFPEYELPFLIEEYLATRRLHAVVLGHRVLEVLPLIEANGRGDAWQLAQLQPELLGRVRDLARRAHRALECRDLAQIDIHLDELGAPHVIDVRPMPDMGPGSPMWAAAGFTERGPRRVFGEVLTHAHERIADQLGRSSASR